MQPLLLYNILISRSFAARYNGIDEFILEDAQSYLTDRGIDNVLSEFIELESVEKMRRENALSLKRLIAFLRIKDTGSA